MRLDWFITCIDNDVLWARRVRDSSVACLDKRYCSTDASLCCSSVYMGAFCTISANKIDSIRFTSDMFFRHQLGDFGVF
jgi:hypothetical protein